MSFALPLMTCLTCLICSRRVTHSSSAAPSQLTPTASFARRRLSSCSSWTACGRSSASFHAPLNLRRVFWCCSSNMPTLLSLAPFWGTVHLRGEPVEIGLLVPIQTGLQFKIIFIVHNLSFIFMFVWCRKYQKKMLQNCHKLSLSPKWQLENPAFIHLSRNGLWSLSFTVLSFWPISSFTETVEN